MCLVVLSGCGSGSGGTPQTITAPPSGEPPTLTASVPPTDATDVSKPAVVTISLPDGERTTLHTAGGGSGDIFRTPAGSTTVQFAFVGARHTTFALAGAASSGGPVTTDRVDALLPGVYLDSTYRGTVHCSTAWTQVTADAVSGTTTCRLADGGTVTAAFHTT